VVSLEQPSFPLFAYGTLKHGHPAHDRWCRGTTARTPARCRGSLFLHPEGYPVLVVPAEASLAIGSTDTLADARRAARGSHGECRTSSSEVTGLLAQVQAPGTEIGVVTGELLALPAGSLSLAELDDYEGFLPGRPSLFVRILVQVTVGAGHEPGCAWTYVAGRLMEGAPLSALPGGVWPVKLAR